MKVMIVTFAFAGATPDELTAYSVEIAPQWAEIPGCLEKTWLLDRATGRCGGVYKFVDEQALRAYQASEMWQAVLTSEQFSDFELSEYEMMVEPTRITHGMPESMATI